MSTELKPKLQGDGFDRIRSINSGSTVEKMWRGLIGYVNKKILVRKRKEEPHNFWKWTLKFTDVKQGRLSGPVSQTTNVSCSSPGYLDDMKHTDNYMC